MFIESVMQSSVRCYWAEGWDGEEHGWVCVHVSDSQIVKQRIRCGKRERVRISLTSIKSRVERKLDKLKNSEPTLIRININIIIIKCSNNNSSFSQTIHKQLRTRDDFFIHILSKIISTTTPIRF